jgi:hypothetical protein
MIKMVMTKSDSHSRFSNIFIRNNKKKVCMWTFNLRERGLFLPVVLVGVLLIVISKYMHVIIAIKEMAVHKIPQKINQALKYLLLRLSWRSFELELLQSEIINKRIPGCLYLPRLGVEFRNLKDRRRGRLSRNF